MVTAAQAVVSTINEDAIRTVLLVAVLVALLIVGVVMRRLYINTLRISATVYKLAVLLEVTVRPDPHAPRRRESDRVLESLGESRPISETRTLDTRE
jgi:hypothetical protein